MKLYETLNMCVLCDSYPAVGKENNSTNFMCRKCTNERFGKSNTVQTIPNIEQSQYENTPISPSNNAPKCQECGRSTCKGSSPFVVCPLHPQSKRHEISDRQRHEIDSENDRRKTDRDTMMQDFKGEKDSPEYFKELTRKVLGDPPYGGLKTNQ